MENAVSLLQLPIRLFMVALFVFVVLLEGLVTGITLLLPNVVLNWFTEKTRQLLYPAVGEEQLNLNPKLLKQVVDVAAADTFVDICALFDYEVEEHVVTTKDGYLLGVHRIGGARGTNWRSKGRANKPVVYMHHGLLMNSEVFVACPDAEQSIAFGLADLGFDVWLGNNRGNKYSRKHVSRSPTSAEFWNFSLDEFALFDIPDTIQYILNCTGQRTLSYIGFSQGSAQAFASFAIHPEMNQSVNAFVALAPAMAPLGINRFVQTFMNASPSLLYFLFGDKMILRSTMFWQTIMYPPLFVRVIDQALRSLFNWRSANISYAQKLASYAHLYSHTSVKSVVHWFQIIRSGSFHMYNDDTSGPFSLSRYQKVIKYPTRNIRVPIALIYGTSDTLLDIDALLAELPPVTSLTAVPGYEHLDILWGEAAASEILPSILEALHKCAASHTKLLLRDGNPVPSSPASKHKLRKSPTTPEGQFRNGSVDWQ